MMLDRIDVYGIDAPDLERVARALEKKFNIELDSDIDSELGGLNFVYDPNPEVDNDQFWSLYWPNDDDADEDEEPFVGLPIVLRIQNAPDMDDVRNKMTEIQEFTVVLEDWIVLDRETGDVIDEYKSDELSATDENVE